MQKYANKYAKYAKYAKRMQKIHKEIRKEILKEIRKMRKEFAGLLYIGYLQEHAEYAKKYAKYPKLGNQKWICRIRTPRFADGLARRPLPWCSAPGHSEKKGLGRLRAAQRRPVRVRGRGPSPITVLRPARWARVGPCSGYCRMLAWCEAAPCQHSWYGPKYGVSGGTSEASAGGGQAVCHRQSSQHPRIRPGFWAKFEACNYRLV